MGPGSWLAAAGDLLLGARCPGCERPWWGLCPECAHTVAERLSYLTRPDPCPAGFPVTATASAYDATMKRLISAHKEHQVLSLTPFLAERLAVALSCLFASRADVVRSASSVVLVPVPSSKAAVRERGFDATWAMSRRAVLMSRTAAFATHPRRLSGQRLLTLSRHVKDQAGLGAAARKANLTGGFRVVGSGVAPNAVVVIVDDVVTTGSSLT
ncbi:MAG: ComF family protein, partial [Propionibacteriaceae bacterium]|nr:ComF family protein [Propionibacteriaceae bacterium]